VIAEPNASGRPVSPAQRDDAVQWGWAARVNHNAVAAALLISFSNPVAVTQPTSSSSFGRRDVAYKIATVFAVVFAVRYFVWRLTATTNVGAMWFFALFLGAELVGFGEAFLFYLTTWRRRVRVAPRAPAGKSVDVFIPTYNEPAEMLRDTVVAALAMRYPHRTWILDDGNRLDVAALASELGCSYLARTDRSDAKAGNLNNALRHSTGEFIVTLDADHIPLPDLIEQLLGFFEHPRAALVQTNQDFFNLDSFQHATDWRSADAWQQQELFFNVIQPGKDALDAAIYCGSPAMIRRAALTDVGGFATETITEDMHTGLRMQKQGWQVIYYNRTVARGLAPQTYLAYNTQWHRWGVGAMQVLRTENPLIRGKLTLRQRLAYFASFYFYWTSYQKLIFLLIPAFCVLTGIFPYTADPPAFLSRFLPYLVANIIAAALVQGGFRPFLNTERYNVIKLGAMLRSPAGLLKRRSSFRVTPKARSSAAGWVRLAPYCLLLVVLAGAAILGMFRAAQAGNGFAAWAYGVNAFFGAFYFYLLAPAVALAMRRRELRNAYRFPRQLQAPVEYRVSGTPEASWSKAYARNMNRFGLSITIDDRRSVNDRIEIRLLLPTRTVNAVASVRWITEFDVGSQKRYAHGLRFEEIKPADQDAIVLYLLWDIAPRHGTMLKLTDASQRSERVA
jgi:cellulose synthase/poly-beta-1,6-N-acetylglucosamine synthase-like glycosyltransferase